MFILRVGKIAIVTGHIYLDNNATTRPHPEVVETVAHHLHQSYANPGSRHAAGRIARKVLEESRERMAEILGAHPGEVVFTSGGTESTNLAIFGATQRVPGTIALTKGEHPATVEACRQLEMRGWNLLTLNVDSRGLLDESQYQQLPWDELHLVCVIMAHNETGVIQDIQPLARICREHQVPIHLDAVQAVGKIPVDFHDLDVSLLSLGAHKFHGPRGVGALLIREDVKLATHLYGGHQESDRRPGTEPVALIAGMVRALEIWQADCERIEQRVEALRDRLTQRLLQSCAPCSVNGGDAPRLPNTLNISFHHLDGEALLVSLDLAGICCSLGSTCASGSAEPAPVLVAMGLEADIANSAVRFSVGQETTEAEIEAAAERIAGVVGRLRSGDPASKSSAGETR